MQHNVSRRSFLALGVAAGTLAATRAAAAEAADPDVTEAAAQMASRNEPTDPVEELLPDDPSHQDFVELAEEHPELLPPDPGPMGEGLDVPVGTTGSTGV